MGLDIFTIAYIEAMLWTTDDDNENPLDKNYDATDIAPDALKKIKADCAKFQEAAAAAIAEADRGAERAGHDFWLTRNGHGAGFWDGDWKEPHGTNLTKLSKEFGMCDAYLGDDGLIYITPF
jgi:hypothetical protein